MTFYVDINTVEIGTTLNYETLTDIVYVAIRLAGSGPGGDHVEFVSVENIIAHFRDIHHAKHWELIIGFNQNLFTALFNTDVEEGVGEGKAIVEDGENTPIDLFRINLTDNKGDPVVWTWPSGTTFVANFFPNIVNEATDQIVEVKFISRGVRAVS